MKMLIMPWEDYNSEDAVLISECLVYEDIYTSFYIQKYEIQTHVTSYSPERAPPVTVLVLPLKNLLVHPF